jgi:hypothetical protein
MVLERKIAKEAWMTLVWREGTRDWGSKAIGQ